MHAVYHKAVMRQRARSEDGGVARSSGLARPRRSRQARIAAQSGDAHDKLMAEGARYLFKVAGHTQSSQGVGLPRQAIALRPDEPAAYYNVPRWSALRLTGHHVEAAQRFLEARERWPMGSEDWAEATALAINMLAQEACAEVAKPEWWNDEGLKALSARVVRVWRRTMRRPTRCGLRCCARGAARGRWGLARLAAAELNEAAAQ